MRTKAFVLVIFLGIATSLSAQKQVSDYVTKGVEDYCIINLSRSSTYQEVRGAKYTIIQLYINDQPVCDTYCPSRASIKVSSEGKLTIGLKFKHYQMPQKRMDKCFLVGKPLELTVEHGKTYFINVDLKLIDAVTVRWTGSIVSIPESEAMFKDESRFKKASEIKEYQEDINNPFIKK